MPTRRIELKTEHLNEARQAAKNRTYSVSKPLLLTDIGERGLILRVRGGKAEFILRYSGSTKTLGALAPERGELKPGEIRTLKDARELAQKARALLRDGLDPKDFLTARAAGKSDEFAEATAKRKTALEAGAWTWADLVHEYADVYLSNPRMKKGVLKPPSERAAKSAKNALTQIETESLNSKLVSELSLGDFEDVRDLFMAAGRKSASRLFVSNAKAAMSHARKVHSRKSGLEGVAPWWLDLHPLQSTLVSPKMREPSVSDIAKTLFLAEKHRLIEGRKVKRETAEITLCAMWWVALTAQRTNAALSIETVQILPWDTRQGPADGWKVVTWSDEVMKSRNFHSLPIPPRLALLLERALLVGRAGSKYVFPSTSLRKGKTDAHIDQNTFKNVVNRLRGKRQDPKGGKDTSDGVDLMTGIPHYTPHDIRRTFAATCSNLLVRPDAISEVLDHEGIETGQKLVRSADVTRISYDHSQKLPLKRLAMEAWTDAVFKACDEVWRNENPLRMSISREQARKADLARIESMESHDGVPFSPFFTWYEIMERKAAKERKPLILPASAQRADEMSDDDQFY